MTLAISDVLNRSLQFFHTIRYLRPVQIYGRLWFRFYSPSTSNKPAPPTRSIVAPWGSGVAQSPSMLAADRFVFLNNEGGLTGPESWNEQDASTNVMPDSIRNPARDKLWLYNLHYFDDLNAVGAAERVDWHRALIERWEDENPVGLGNGWEPYPLSLRIVNWVKWALQGNEMEPGWLDSLVIQVRFSAETLGGSLVGESPVCKCQGVGFCRFVFFG